MTGFSGTQITRLIQQSSTTGSRLEGPLPRKPKDQTVGLPYQGFAVPYSARDLGCVVVHGLLQIGRLSADRIEPVHSLVRLLTEQLGRLLAGLVPP